MSNAVKTNNSEISTISAQFSQFLDENASNVGISHDDKPAPAHVITLTD
jgi:hypothetical protein